MLKQLFFILIVSILTACSDGTQNVNLQEKLKKDTTVTSQQIIFAQPQTIDSSNIIIYPLIFQKETYDGSYGSSSGGQRASYWNLIFYNTETEENKLLTLDKKILIYTFNLGSSSSSSSYSSDNLWSNGINVYKNNIIYTVVTNDYNSNKQLDENDPTYLFISNRDGTNFRQISPDNFNISSWEVVKGTTKIIMQGQKDDNADKSFNDKDANVPLIVDVNNNTTAKETFKEKYIDSLKQRLLNIWRR